MTTGVKRIADLYEVVGPKLAALLSGRSGLPGDVVEDAVHDLFIKLLEDSKIAEKVLSLNSGDQIAYLFVAARRRTLRILQHRRSEESMPEELLARFVIDERAANDRAAAEVEEIIRVELGKLREPYLSVLQLLLVKRRRASEIAEELGRPVNTVYQHIHRGLEHLRDAVRKAMLK